MWRFVLVTNVLVIGRVLRSLYSYNGCPTLQAETHHCFTAEIGRAVVPTRADSQEVLPPVSLQPITAETTQDGRQSRQLDISDCCPCPENADSTSKTSWRLEKTAGDGSLKTNLDDECPCLPRDSEGSSSMIFPTALRSGAATRLMDPKEDPKNLLEPEVGLASSVLETLRQATEEEYQDALARDAARANANDDAVPEESALNTVTIILPQRSVDDRDTEETLDSQNSQESKYLDPLGSTIKKQIQSKTYSGLNDILRLPQVERLTFLQKKLLNVGNGVSTSKFLERNEETTNKAPMLKSPLTNQERDRTEFFEDQGQSIIHQSDDSEALNKEQCNFSTKIIESMKIKKAEGVENDLDLAASDINANVARSQDEFESIEMTKATANKNPLFHNSLILRELPKRIQLVDKMNGKMNLKQISASQQDYRKSILSDLTNNGLKFDINKRKWIDFKDTENEEEDTVQSSRQRQEEEVAQPTNEYKTMDLSNESDTMNDTEGKLLNDSSFENLNEEAQKFINSNEISSENFSRSQNSEEILNTELLNTLFQVAPNRDHSNWNKGTRVNDSHTTNKHNTSNIFHEEDIKDSIQNDMIPENTEIKTVVLDKLSKTVPKYINRNEKNIHSADEKPEFSNNIPLLQDKFIKNSLINQNVLSDSTQENPKRSLLSNVIEAQNTFNENYELQNKSGESKIDKNNVSREMSMNDLQDLSDTLLKLSIAGENGAKDENNLVCEKWSEASRASLPKPNDATIVVNNLQTDKDDLQNDEGDTSIKDSTKARVSNQPEKENRSRILSVGADPVEMTAEGSNSIMSSIQRNPFDYLRDNNFKSALSVDKVVQPNFDLFRSETGTGLILPTLDNIKEKVTQFFSPHDRESEKEQIDCIRESQMITAEESSPMSRSRSLLAPLEDVNLDIFQLKPLTLPNYFPKNTPRVNLKTYRAKLPIPKNLGMKPLIFESSLGNREGLIGTAFSVGPQSKSRFHEIYATPMPNLPGLQEIRENLKLHTTNLLQNPINFNRGSLFEPDILSITDNLRQRAEGTLADMKEKIESSLYGVNSMDVFGDSLRSHDILEKLTGTRDDFSEKLKGIQYDLNDRLTSFQEQLLDKTRLMSKSKLLFKDKQNGNLRSSPHSLNVNSKVKKVSRLNDDKSTKLGASRLNHVDSDKMKKFRMPTAASVPIPYSIQVPELKMAYIDPPVNSADRQQNFSRLSDLLSRSAALRDSTQNTKIKKIGAKKENKFKVSFTPLSNENSDNRKSLGSVTDTNESLSALVPLKVRDSEINSKLKSMEYEEDIKELTRGDEDKLKFQHKLPYFSKAQSIESDKGSSLSRNSLSSSNYKANKLLTSTSWPNTEEYSFLSKVRNNIKEKLSKLDSSLKINRNKPFNDHTIYESYEQMVNDEASENTNVASQSFGIKSPISFRSQRVKDNDEKVMDADESPSQVAPIRSQYPNTCMEQKIVAISDDSDSLRQAQEGNDTIVKPKLPKIKYPIKTSGRVMGFEEIEPSESLSDNKPLRSRAKQLLVTMNSPVFRQELNSEDTEEIPTTTVQPSRPKIKYPLKTRSRVQATHETEPNESSLKTRKHNMPDKLEVSLFRENPDSEQMDDRITTTAKPSLPKIKYPLKTKGRAHDSEGTETDGSPLQSQVPEMYTRLKVPVFRDEHNSEEIEECPTTTARPPLPKIKYPLKNKGRIHDIEGIETNGSPLESRVVKLYTRLKPPVFREEPDSEQIDDPTTTTAKPQLPKIKYPLKTKARVQDIEGTEADGSLLEFRGPEMYTRLRVPVFRDENNSEEIEECATTAMPQLPKIKYPMKTKGRLQNIEDMDPYVSPSKIVSLKAPAKEPCTEIKRPVFRHEDSTEETKDIPTTTAKPTFPKIKYPLKTRSGIQNTEDTEINRNPLNHRIKELYNRLKAPVWRDDHGSEEITESAITTVKPQVPKIKYPLKTKSRVQEIEQIDPNGSLTISVPLKTRVEDLYNRLKIPVFRDKQNSERQSELQRETEETVTTTAKPHVPKIKYPLKTRGRHQNLEDRESNGNIPIRGTSVVLREEEENPKKQQCYTQATTVKPIQVINHIKYPLWNIKPSSAENDDTHTDPQDSVRSSDKDESIKQRLSKTWPKPADSSFLTKVREAVKERLSKLDPTKILDENVYNKPKARSFDMERSPTENHAIIFKSAEELPSTTSRPTTKMPKIKYPIQGRLQNLQHDDFSPSDSLRYSGMDLTRKKIPSLTWPTKTEENSLLTKLRDAVKERLSKFDPSHLSENLPAKLDPENEMERSGSENVGIIAPDALKENVSYKCRMVCTKEN